MQIVVVLMTSAFLYSGFPFLYGRWHRRRLIKRARDKKALVLTFDDGPGSRLTPIILGILADYTVNASFFLLGRNITGREEIVKQIAAAGHEICSHGYDHPHYWRMTPFRTVADIKKGWQAIDSALAEKRGTYPFRPPYGELNLISLLYLWFQKVPIFYWSLDTRDTWPAQGLNCKRINVHVKETGGAVTLAHDFDRKNDDLNRMVIDSLRSTLSMAKESGMKILTISELVENIGGN